MERKEGEENNVLNNSTYFENNVLKEGRKEWRVGKKLGIGRNGGVGWKGGIREGVRKE